LRRFRWLSLAVLSIKENEVLKVNNGARVTVTEKGIDVTLDFDDICGVRGRLAQSLGTLSKDNPDLGGWKSSNWLKTTSADVRIDRHISDRGASIGDVTVWDKRRYRLPDNSWKPSTADKSWINLFEKAGYRNTAQLKKPYIQYRNVIFRSRY